MGESSYEDKTKPPTISLTDPLLSVITYDNDFSSGSYEWTYKDGKENVSVIFSFLMIIIKHLYKKIYRV